ncbi:hypothetical protein [Sorangium sp. So ce1078]|uniref:hypothetical protein n=1 Tax=Sorangium sp. So ce1078 TaxID=3133329 RepID=UPI003F609810
MKGFAAERGWPAGEAIWRDVTMVSGIDRQVICSGIHSPAMALCAHTDGGGEPVPRKATLDQHLAGHIAAETPFRSLNLSPTGDRAVTQASDDRECRSRGNQGIGMTKVVMEKAGTVTAKR